MFRHIFFNLIVESLPPICFPATSLVANEFVFLNIWFARQLPLCHADFSCHILVCARLHRCLYLKILNICNITSIIIHHFTSYNYNLRGSSHNLDKIHTKPSFNYRPFIHNSWKYEPVRLWDLLVCMCLVMKLGSHATY